MEPLWSRVVATRGRRWQIARSRKRQNQAKTVALGCDQLLKRAHGKECHEEGPPAESCSARPRETKGGPTQCCTPVWISVASVSTSTSSTSRVKPSRSVRRHLTQTDFAA